MLDDLTRADASSSAPHGVAADLLSLIRAFASTGNLEEAVFESVAGTLQHIGDALNERQAGGVSATSPGAGSPLIAQAKPGEPLASEPKAVHVQPGFAVLWKPPGWTVSVSDEGAEVLKQVHSASGSQLLHEWHHRVDIDH